MKICPVSPRTHFTTHNFTTYAIPPTLLRSPYHPPYHSFYLPKPRSRRGGVRSPRRNVADTTSYSLRIKGNMIKIVPLIVEPRIARFIHPFYERVRHIHPFYERFSNGNKHTRIVSLFDFVEILEPDPEGLLIVFAIRLFFRRRKRVFFFIRNVYVILWVDVISVRLKTGQRRGFLSIIENVA